MFYRHILARWEILKENTDESKNFVFVCLEIAFSINFALENV